MALIVPIFIFYISSIIAVWYITKIKMETEIKQLSSNLSATQDFIEKYKKEIENLNILNSKLLTEKVSIDSKNEYLAKRIEEQKEEVQKAQERMKIEFRNVANNILEEKTKKFTDQNKVNLENILNPFREKISEYQNKIEQTNKEGIERTASLKTEIKKISESSLQISKDAEGLTKALKGDNKLQGNWGEFILESILEKSGLIKDREYFVQKSLRNEDSKLFRPDVIINLPDDKNIIIDSKVSLVHYAQYINEDNDQKLIYLQKHLNSIKNHITELSNKQYQSLYNLNTLDFVLMFMPIEPSFALASQKDPSLFNKALEKNIVIVSPSTLMATLKTIKHTWKTEYQTRNVQEIARQGGALYDKFVSFTEDLIKIGKRIESTHETYQLAAKKLYTGKDNLIKKTEKLKELGASTKKSISPLLLEKT
ncbi:MAG: DNA recombination protein RmuC [Bacteroidetes bacterium]|nr:DNA recombination protein RmuC [Bacteroidota bacterium]